MVEVKRHKYNARSFTTPHLDVLLASDARSREIIRNFIARGDEEVVEHPRLRFATREVFFPTSGGFMNRKSMHGRIGTILAVGTFLLASGAIQRGFAMESAKFFTQLDAFLPGNATDGPDDFAQSSANGLVGSGYSSSSFNSDAKSGYGIRVGLFAPVRSFELGGSLGYVFAPKVDTHISGTSTLLGDGSTDREKKTQYIRLLAEARKKWPFRDSWSFNLGAGLGVAQGHTKDSVTNAGSVTTGNGGSENKLGFTWEISPSVSFKNYDLGLRYAGFPKIDGNSNVADFKWSTLGFFVGANF